MWITNCLGKGDIDAEIEWWRKNGVEGVEEGAMAWMRSFKEVAINGVNTLITSVLVSTIGLGWCDGTWVSRSEIGACAT